jgi:hypothetical protein
MFESFKKGVDALSEGASSVGKSISDGASSVSDHISEGISDVGTHVKSTGEYIVNKFEGIEFNKLVSMGNSESTEFDTTHYFLIPDLNDSSNFTLHTYRELPKNTIDTSNLIKKKIFHLPTENYFELLKEKVLAENKSKHFSDSDFTSSTADSLSDVANTIDSANDLITNGLLIAGSLVCLANPVTGVILLGSAFLPSIASNLITSPVKHLSKKLKLSSLDSRNKDAENLAMKELQSVKPEMQINSVLKQFYHCINDKEYDPIPYLNDDCETLRLIRPVLKPVYEKIINDNSFFKKHDINSNIKNYYKAINE